MMHNTSITGEENPHLSQFKRQISSVLQKINDFDEADKNEAVEYVRKFIEAKSSTSSFSHELTEDISKEVPSGFSETYVKKKRKTVIKKVSSLIVSKKTRISLMCRICNDIKPNKLSLLKHMGQHAGTPISCLMCRQSFNNKTAFDWHLIHVCTKRSSILSKTYYACPECPKRFHQERHLKLHVEGHKRNNCSYCDIVLTRREQLVQHMLEVHKIKLEKSYFACNHCEKRFVKCRSLYYHLQQHFPDKHICLECGVSTDTIDEYEQHFKKHEEEKPWKCNRCADRFSRRQQFLFHLKRHDLYKCVTCKENFASKMHAHKHLKRGHIVQGLEPKFHCPYCSAAFHRTLLLQLHIRKHKEETTTISCKFCNKTFHTPYQYYKHCKTTLHDKNSPEVNQFICENCGKQFAKKYLLEQHLVRFHKADRTIFTCKYCDYKTYFKPNLERHINLHFSGNKQFICDHCGKAFSNLGGMTDHIDYMHIQEKQFKCGQCDKSFKRNSELIRHQSSHSDARPYACNLCKQAYKRLNHLKRHEESVHGLTVKSKKVQRLKTDSTGAVIPVPIEPKKSNKRRKTSTKSIESYPGQDTDEFYKTTVIDSVSISKPSENITLNSSEFPEGFWTDKIQENKIAVYPYNGSSLPQVASTDLQTLNMVDQFVKSLLPSKNLRVMDCQNYNEYACSSSTSLEFEDRINSTTW